MSIVGGLNEGVASFPQMLALLSDPEALAKRFEALDKREKEVSTLISLVGPASEVLQIREQLKADQQKLLDDRKALEEEGRAILARAQVEAEARIQAAKKTVSELLDQAREQLTSAQSDRNQAATELTRASDSRQAAEAQQQKLDLAIAECLKKSAALDKDRQSHVRAREDLSARAKRLQDAIDGVK